MKSFSPAMGLSSLVLLVLFLVLAPLVSAQQPNSAGAALSVNGTGRLTPLGVQLVDSSVSPPPPGGAFGLHHRAMARSEVELSVTGTTPLAPVVVVLGTPGGPTTLCGGTKRLEIDLASLTFLLAPSPGGLLGAGAALDASGRWRLSIPQGLPPGFPQTTFQAAVLDPSACAGFHLSASISLEIRNDLDTLMRNFLDGLDEILVQPSLLPSLLHTNFLHDGQSATTFVLLHWVETLFEDSPEDLAFVALGPNQTNQICAPCAGGPPSAGQTATFRVTVQAAEPTVAGLGIETLHAYDLQAREEVGVWKFYGDRRDACVSVGLDVRPPTAIGGPPRVLLRVDAEDLVSFQGGISSAQVTGPQFAAPQPLAYCDSNLFGSEWCGEFLLPMAPLVEHPTNGPQDTYQVSVSWADPGFPISGPYALPVRAAIDIAANPAAALAAIPDIVGTPVVNNPGTSATTLLVLLNPGVLPPSEHSHICISIFQSATGAEGEMEFLIPTNGVAQPVVLDVAGLQPGAATLDLESVDRFGTRYSRSIAATVIL